MTNKISRAQWEQISKRVHLAGFAFDPKWKCFIDGKKFSGRDCDHTVEENEQIVAQIRQREVTP